MHARITTMKTIAAKLVLTMLTFLVALAAAGPAHAATSRPHVSWAPHIDRKIVPTRSESFGRQVATWYGPGFFGRRTACGQTLREDTWGIAHRTLPCGTLVSLVHRGRRVTVPVIDRGPFSGATVDLTSRTKRFLHFASGSVKMVRVRRFRVLPLVRIRNTWVARPATRTAASPGVA